MGDRGRKPASALSVVSEMPEERPAPPKELTPEQAEEWRGVVNRLPMGWFPRETHALLTQYCRHVVECREIASLIQEAKGNPDTKISDYDRLTKMAEREGRAMSSLATRLRLTPQSTYDPRKSKGSTAKKPWEVAK